MDHLIEIRDLRKVYALGEEPVAMLHEMAEVFGRLPWQKQAEEMDDAQIEAA